MIVSRNAVTPFRKRGPAVPVCGWALVLMAVLGQHEPHAADPVGSEEPRQPGHRFAWSVLAALPDPRGVAGAFAGVAGRHDAAERDGVLVVAGGANFPDRPPWDGGTKAWHTAAYVLPAPDAAWLTVAPLPQPLAYGVSASFGGRIWCVGGADAAAHVRSSFAIDWDADACALRIETDALPPLPMPMALGGGVLVGSRLFIAGGLESPAATEALGAFRSIDLGAPAGQRAWRDHPTWPGERRILPVLGALDGKVYLVSGAALVPDRPGGFTRRFLTDAYEFDPTSESWRKIADCPAPLAAAPSPAIPLDATCLAFLPGDDGSLFFTQKELAGRHPGFPRPMHLYDAASNAWRPLGVVPDLARPTVTTPTVAWSGGWIVASGEVQPGVRSPQIVRLMPEATGVEREAAATGK